jgi:hypothetical protein
MLIAADNIDAGTQLVCHAVPAERLFGCAGVDRNRPSCGKLTCDSRKEVNHV